MTMGAEAAGRPQGEPAAPEVAAPTSKMARA